MTHVRTVTAAAGLSALNQEWSFRFRRTLSSGTTFAIGFGLAAMFVGAPRLCSQDFPVPPHPTLLSATYRGRQLPVVAAVNNQPVVIIGESRQTLPADTPLATDRGARYAPASAELTGGVSKRTPVVFRNFGNQQTKVEELEIGLTITASEDLSDCYLVIISYDADSVHNPDIPDSSSISLNEVGTLQKGVPKKVDFSSRLVFPERYATKAPALGPEFTVMRQFWQLFSGGNEVQTNLPLVVADFFYHRERRAHKLAVASWRQANSSGNRPAQPLLQIPPLLGSTDGLPQPATATLSLGADGTVTRVVLDQPFPDAAEAVLQSTLRAWLFLPAIKNGKPVPVRLRVPLVF